MATLTCLTESLLKCQKEGTKKKTKGEGEHKEQIKQNKDRQK